MARWVSLVGLVAALGGCAHLQKPASGPADVAAVDAVDRRLEHARTIASRGAPSPTPHLDRLTRQIAATTTQLGLQQLITAGDGGPPTIRPGDRLQVEVVSQPSLGGERVVDPRGWLEVPPLGRVRAEGLTLDALAEQVGAALTKEYLQRRGKVLVHLIERVPASVQVTGRVGAHGDAATEQRLTTTEALLPPHRSLSVHELLGKVGGLSDDAADTSLALVRTTIDAEGTAKRVCYHFGYDELVTAHLAGRDAWLHPGDHLVVPRLADVHVHGEVETPGRLALRPGDTVATLIERAGGWTTAADRGGVLVLRGDTEEEPIALADRPRAGDVLFVPTRNRIYVVGKGVARNGSITYPEGGLSAIQALSEAGWFTPTADTGGVVILRRVDGARRERIPIDVDDVLDGDAGEDGLMLQPGDILLVPEVSW